MLLSSFLRASTRGANAPGGGWRVFHAAIGENSQGNDLAAGPVTNCIPFWRNSNSAIVASPGKGQQETAPAGMEISSGVSETSGSWTDLRKSVLRIEKPVHADIG
jgi:hypothetical protein